MLDYLIVGHGLAGAVLSKLIMDKGRSCMVMDQFDPRSSSNVAGGLYNPITGRKMVATWKADALFSLVEPFYTALEAELRAKFLHNIGVYRPFLTVEECNDWEGKRTSPKFSAFVQNISSKPHESKDLNDPIGGLYLKPAGWVNIPVLLEANKFYLHGKGSYTETMFNMSQLINKKTHFEYDQLRFKRLIFCNGRIMTTHGFFGWLPFSPVKGELLTLQLEKPIETIYNRGIFMLPLDGNRCKAGATYDWKNVNRETSDHARLELIEKVKGLYGKPFHVVDHVAGIRPATRDRRPLIGRHPQEDKIYIFNGFGSKGVSLIPYFGKQFVGFLEEDSAIDDEVNISRYFSLYYNKQNHING